MRLFILSVCLPVCLKFSHKNTPYQFFGGDFYEILTAHLKAHRFVLSWTDVLYWCNDAVGSWMNWFFFFIIIIVCAMIMLNLVLGVLSGKFGMERERILTRQRVFESKVKAITSRQISSYK